MSNDSTEDSSLSEIVDSCGGVLFKDLGRPVVEINPWKHTAGMPHMRYGNQTTIEVSYLCCFARNQHLTIYIQFMYASVMLLVQRV